MDVAARNATLALVGAAGLAAGVVLGGWLARDGAPVRGLAAPATPSALAPVLSELARVLDELRGTLERRAMSPAPALDTPEREAMASGPSADRAIAAALDALASSLRGLERAGEPGVPRVTTRGLVVPAWVNRTAAFAGTGLRQAQEADDELGWERAMEAFKKKHLFWTTQQILDAYGKPDEIQVGQEYSTWTYRLPVGADQEEYSFGFSDGLVFSCEYDY